MTAETRGGGRRTGRPSPRIRQVEQHGAGDQVRRLVDVGRRGLPLTLDVDTGRFAQTVRRSAGPGPSVRREGTSLRYTAIAALGLARLDVAEQQGALGGSTAADLVRALVEECLGQPDPGAVALAAWAAAEVCGVADPRLLARLGRDLASGNPVPTVDVSWMLTAAVASGAAGLFPHVLPSGSQGRWRRHVGSFADQVYPIQALARLFRVTADTDLLVAAEATADRICELQGSAGQWWWHHDVRTGDVVERFPVYSVHQHAMAPMTLFDLAEAGGSDRTDHVVRGLRWLDTHPEVDEDLVDESAGVIWRKAGRREPRKAVRRLSAVTTAIRPGLHLPGLDRAFPPVRVDHECRPYELGWLLHAWLPPLAAVARG